jgi:hypothetical protein
MRWSTAQVQESPSKTSSRCPTSTKTVGRFSGDADGPGSATKSQGVLYYIKSLGNVALCLIISLRRHRQVRNRERSEDLLGRIHATAITKPTD